MQVSVVCAVRVQNRGAARYGSEPFFHVRRLETALDRVVDSLVGHLSVYHRQERLKERPGVDVCCAVVLDHGFENIARVSLRREAVKGIAGLKEVAKRE